MIRRLFKRHDCHFVKHYDHKAKRYVNRCTICGKVVERERTACQKE